LLERDAEHWRALFEERAAIREHDGVVSRAEAEAGALGDLAAQWRYEHPLPASGDTVCAYCGNVEPDTRVLARSGHAWLHRACWGPMHARRRDEAEAAVRQMLGMAE
jgi:hypothetical protein